MQTLLISFLFVYYWEWKLWKCCLFTDSLLLKYSTVGSQNFRPAKRSQTSTIATSQILIQPNQHKVQICIHTKKIILYMYFVNVIFTKMVRHKKMTNPMKCMCSKNVLNGTIKCLSLKRYLNYFRSRYLSFSIQIHSLKIKNFVKIYHIMTVLKAHPFPLCAGTHTVQDTFPFVFNHANYVNFSIFSMCLLFS